MKKLYFFSFYKLINAYDKKKNRLFKNQLDFPFLYDKKTIEFIKRTKIVFIMRGLPGSGKSFLGKQIFSKYKKSSVICSADDYFMRDGIYNYNNEAIPLAHQFCKDKFVKSIEENFLHIIIDNTNIKKWEFNYYLNLASKHNYLTLIVTPNTSWKSNPEILAKLNKHECSIEYIENRLKQFQNVIPLYWGFFLNQETSLKIIKLSEEFFVKCSEVFSCFKNDLLKNKLDKDFSCFFNQQYQINLEKLLHCTSFFIGTNNDGLHDISLKFSQEKFVKNFIGKVSNLSIISLVFSPRTIGAKVELSKVQLRLWKNSDIFCFTDSMIPSEYSDNYENSPIHDTSFKIINDSLKKIDYNAENSNDLLENISCLSTEKLNSSKEPIDNSLLNTAPKNVSQSSTNNFSEIISLSSLESKSNKQLLPIKLYKGARAHLTIGYNELYQPVQTGFDILNTEYMYSQKPPNYVILHKDNETYFYYGEGQCEVFFDEPKYYTSLFNGSF